ncbi:hypothetical protein BDV18DRAFT_161013 [Aspergillus unguis]
MSTESTIWSSISRSYPSPTEVSSALQATPNYNTTKADRIAKVQLELIKAVKDTDLSLFKLLSKSFFDDGPESYLIDPAVGIFVQIISALTIAKPASEKDESPELLELYSDLKKMANIAITHVCAWPDSYTRPEVPNKTRYREVVLHQVLWLAAQHQETYVTKQILKAVEGEEMDIYFFFPAIMMAADVAILGSIDVLELLIKTVFPTGGKGRSWKDAKRAAELLGLDVQDPHVQEHVSVLKTQGIAQLLNKDRYWGAREEVKSLLLPIWTEFIGDDFEEGEPNALEDFITKSLRIYGRWDRQLKRKLIAALEGGDLCLELAKEDLLNALNQKDLASFNHHADSFFAHGPDVHLLAPTMYLLLHINSHIHDPLADNDKNKDPTHIQSLKTTAGAMANNTLKRVFTWRNRNLSDKTRHRDVVLHFGLILAALRNTTSLADRIINGLLLEEVDLAFFSTPLAEAAAFTSIDVLRGLLAAISLEGGRVWKDETRAASALGVSTSHHYVREHIAGLRAVLVASAMNLERIKPRVKTVLLPAYVEYMGDPAYLCFFEVRDGVVKRALARYAKWERESLVKLESTIEGEVFLDVRRGVQELVRSTQ